MLLQAEKDKFRLKEEIREHEQKITAAVSYFGGLEEIFTEQRDLFLKKVHADFEVITKMVERKRAQMVAKITESYDGHL